MKDVERKILTLCIIHKHPWVLLGMKKRGFGEGRWNGFGGKVEKGEEIEKAALRELREEAGVKVKKLEHMSVLDFSWNEKPGILEVHIFKGKGIAGDPRESEEMKPQWFHVDTVPFHSMWADDQHWFPLFLVDKKFRGKFLFNDADRILGMEIKEVREI